MIRPAAPAPALRRTRAAWRATAWRVLACVPTLTIWSWACRHAIIPPEESSKPGRWQPARARLFRHALEVISARLTGRPLPYFPHAHRVRLAIFCGPSQIGKTKSFLHPILSYCIDVLRTNCAFLTHKHKQIRQHLTVRLLPMFLRTPRLARYLPPTQALRRERLAGNLWQLEGANLHALCANVASDLREYSHPVGIMDEPEAYALDADGEGDPIELFLDRQKRYPDTSILAGASTPNTVFGHTWAKLCGSLHLRLMVRCLACGHDQDLSVDRLRPTNPTATPDEIEAGDLARWHCAICDAPHTSEQVDRIVATAELDHRWIPGTWSQDDEHPAGHWQPATIWRHQADGTTTRVDIGHWRPHVCTTTGLITRHHQLISVDWPIAERVGWHCTYLHDASCSNGRFLAHEIRARNGSAQEWHTHVTGWRAEPLILAGDLLSTDQITAATATPYTWQTCPADARWLLIACDQQGNTVDGAWFAYETRAVNPGGESWLVDAGIVRGFDGLRQLQERRYPIGPRARSCDRIAVDGANGMLARELRAWAIEPFAALVRSGMPPEIARARTTRILLLGDEKLAADLPWIERQATKRDRVWHHPGVRIFRWNLLHWKDRTHRRLAGDQGLPPLHLPTDDAATPKDLTRYLRSCTSEERVIRAIGAPGGRQRHAVVWQERCYVDPQGRTVQRSDTHWWDAANMIDVLADLVGAYHLPGVEAQPPATAQPDSPAPTRTTQPQRPPVTPRRHSRLARRAR
jgi:hypothetical protein